MRVDSLEGVGRFESVAKAILAARESTDPDAAGVTVFVMPAAPGDDAIVAHSRDATGADTNVLGRVSPGGLPGVWLRIRRAGDVFTAFHSRNGADWVEIGNTTAALASSLQVGLGVVSHRSGRLAVGKFSYFPDGQAPAAGITIVNASYAAGVFSAAFNTQTGATYDVQYKDDLSTANWSMLTTITGDGSVKPFNDPGPVPASGARFYRVAAR